METQYLDELNRLEKRVKKAFSKVKRDVNSLKTKLKENKEKEKNIEKTLEELKKESVKEKEFYDFAEKLTKKLELELQQVITKDEYDKIKEEYEKTIKKNTKRNKP